MSTVPEYYDLVIVGAGLAGLWTGIESLKKFPKLRCIILEKYNYLGGRVISYKKTIPKVGPVIWENGAARISQTHRLVLNLIKRYKLAHQHMDDIVDFLPVGSTPRAPVGSTLRETMFGRLIDVYMGPLYSLTSEVLGTHTIGELLEQIHGPTEARKFYIEFPYYAEIHNLRADLALESFANEMASYKGYYCCPKGLSGIVDGMVTEFSRLGGKICKETELLEVSQYPDGRVKLLCNGNREFVGGAAVLALHSAALKGIKGVSELPVLNKLGMSDLLRMYAVFPKTAGKVWFSSLPKVVTDSPLRFIIPIDYKRGIIMISYTDGPDARRWMRLPSEDIEEAVMREVRTLFRNIEIPDPIFFKRHPWYEGCTYWKPGQYLPQEESIKALQPLPKQIPGLFMCGESFSLKQAWMEGALEHADLLCGNKQYNAALRKCLER